MQSTTKFIGLDVSKEKIAVAVAEAGREEPRWYGTIPHTAEALRKLIKQLGDKDTLAFCYEAGPTGYEAYRWITSMGAQCCVIAPTLIPKRTGDRIKTDRRDALQLARLFRAGELTSIYVPTREDEALRDLIRSRSDAKEDLHRARQRLIKFLLRHQIHHPVTIKRRWTQKYRNWLDTLKFETQPALKPCGKNTNMPSMRLNSDRNDWSLPSWKRLAKEQKRRSFMSCNRYAELLC